MRKRRTPSYKRRLGRSYSQSEKAKQEAHRQTKQRSVSLSEIYDYHSKCDTSNGLPKENTNNKTGFHFTSLESAYTSNQILNYARRGPAHKSDSFLGNQSSSSKQQSARSSQRTYFTVFHFDDNFNAIQSDKKQTFVLTGMKAKSGKKPIRIHLTDDESILLVFEVCIDTEIFVCFILRNCNSGKGTCATVVRSSL